MNLNEINFSFAGKHCFRDFGCTYVEDGGHTISAQIRRNNYALGGASGTVAMPGKVHEPFILSGKLYFETSPPSQAAAQKLLRRMIAWLTQGRQRLVFDYEPDRFYLAEVNAPTRWSFESWIDGGLSVQFECQPFAYNTRESMVRLVTAATTATLTLTCDTVEPAPLKVHIQNTGTASITGIGITCAGKVQTFANLPLAAGASFTMDMEPPAGATIGTADALPYSSRFDYVEVENAPTTITIKLTYGTGTKNATITASARGRF